MFVIIKKGENVNVCIQDFDDVKEESNKAASNDKHLLSLLIHIRILIYDKFCKLFRLFGHV